MYIAVYMYIVCVNIYIYIYIYIHSICKFFPMWLTACCNVEACALTGAYPVP